MNFDWSELAFGNKKPLRELTAVFIAASRQLSTRRFTQLVKQYLPKANIVLGLAKEPFVAGFEGQPQFRTLAAKTVRPVISKVNGLAGKHKIYTLSYFQREQKHLFEKLNFQQAIFVNGSWQQMFHTSETYYALMRAGLGYERVSPFADEVEARLYETTTMHELHKLHSAQLKPGIACNSGSMLTIAQTAAVFSFDPSYQTGAALGKKTKQRDTYKLLATSFNKVVPFQTYAWHFGPSREANFSPPGDLNYYDAVHAEVAMLIKTNAQQIDLTGTSFFINLLPCPTCARMLSQTPIAEFVYRIDHSDGYAVKMLELAGKKVRRLV